MKQLWIGIVIVAFGLLVGGVGVATAGIGIGVPVIPIGLYIAYRGWRDLQHQRMNDNSLPLELFERTQVGKLSLGVIIFLVGVGTSELIIGIPIIVYSIWHIYKAFK
jgi:hypothetical protein